ncbi:hypothetical protein AAFG13_10305 [Bradyrhizobium sp. B124]|uniref:hypothetical protein n=1 Tax=Bradyrhizobium sp. B124 TaxID=3140245 RepID=UPI003183D77A
MKTKMPDNNPEITAMGNVYAALRTLDAEAQLRVLRYCAEMLGLNREINLTRHPVADDHDEPVSDDSSTIEPKAMPADTASADNGESINTVAFKWMRRSAFSEKDLEQFFSLGIDEIDLVAKSVPGNGKKERMRSVLLLKGIAAYLGTGTPRISYEQLKEACLHYDAYDGTNYAKHIKSFAAEAGGSKAAGYTLTARGLTSATELLKSMMGNKSKT